MLPRDLPEVPVASLDTETSGLHEDDGARVACVAVAWPGGSAAFPFDQGVRDKLPTFQLDLLGGEDPNLTEKDWKDLLAWCQERQLIYHNAKFDVAMMRVGTRHWGGVDLMGQTHWDTMLASAVLEPTNSAALDACCKRAGIGEKTGLTVVKQWLKAHKLSTKRYDLVPWEVIEPYVTTDAELTLDLFDHQVDRIEDPEDEEGHAPRFEREMELLSTLYYMEARGIKYDAAMSLEAAEQLEKRADEIEATMPFPCVPSEAKRWFFEKEELPPDRVSEKTGAPSLDEEQLRDWEAQGVKWAKEYNQVGTLRRAVSMWYRGYPDKIGLDGRLRCNFRQAKVKSGRMSVERVQLQAMPKDDKAIEGIPTVRSLLRAEKGMGLWSLDLSQAELRVAAQYSGCGTMLDLLAKGADIHGVTCEQVMGISRDDPEWKFKRDIAKRLTFGSIFQIGGKKFQATLAKLANIHLPLEECASQVHRWRSLYPEFGVAYRKADKMASSKRYVPLLPKTEYEMKSWLGERDWPHTGWSRIVQGSLAYFFKLWMIEIEKEFPGRMILTIHDSVELELPLSEGDEIAAAVAAQGQRMATELFMKPETGVIMPVDQERWD